MAVEDIRLADPRALVVCNAAKDVFNFLGSPEANFVLTETVVYIAIAPSRTANYVVHKAAMRAANEQVYSLRRRPSSMRRLS
jgi:putative ATPase